MKDHAFRPPSGDGDRSPHGVHAPAAALLLTLALLHAGCDPSAKPPPPPAASSPAPIAPEVKPVAPADATPVTPAAAPRPTEENRTLPPSTAQAPKTPGGNPAEAPSTATALNIDDTQLPDLVRERMKTARERLAAAPNNCDAVIQVGILCLANQQFDEARSAFTRATQVMPRNPRGWYCLALAEGAQGRKDKAIAALEQTKTLDEKIAAVHYRLGEYAREAGDFQKAVEHYRRAADLDAASDEPYLRMGQCLQTLREDGKALDAFRRAVEINPRSAPANTALAALLTAQGKADEAAEPLRRAARNYLSTPVDDPWGADVVDQGRPDEAIERRRREILAGTHVLSGLKYLEGVLKEAPEHVGALRALAECYSVLGSPKSAERCLRRLELLVPDDRQVKLDYASALTRVGRPEEAETIARELLKKNPEDSGALVRLGEIQATRSKYADALATLTKAAALAPNDAMIQCILADVCGLAKKPDEVGQHVEAALKIDSKFAPALHRRGLRREAAGDDAGAREDWLAAIDAAPQQPAAYVSLAEFSCRVRDFDLYQRVAREGLMNLPDSAVILNLVAWLRATCPKAEFRNGAEAVRLAERAMQMSQPIPDLYDTLAAAHAEAGNFEAAVASIRSAIDLAEKNGRADLARAFKDRLNLYQGRKPYRMPG